MSRKKPVAPERKSGEDGNLYRAIGGAGNCRALSAAFYARVDRDPLLRPLFPGTTLTCAIEEFAAFLIQFLGGPAEYSQRRWWLSLGESHRRFKITAKHRDAWMGNMVKALDDVQIEESVCAVLRRFFEQSSAYVVNEGQRPPIAEDQVEPGGGIRREMACRWDVQRRLDEAVAAIRIGASDLAVATAESSILRTCDRSVIAGLLALMIRSSHDAMLTYVREKLASDPALAHERYAGRTLLHEALAHGNSSMVELLLQLGADPNAKDGGGHTPLYSLGNQCRVAGSGNLVRILVQRGANVDANDGVKHCTALHMAARRGNAEIAEALLDCGADIEARDSLGDTALRRSVNCNKVEVASLLLSRGADRRSIGNKGLTPLLAARTDAMKRLLQSGNRPSP